MSPIVDILRAGLLRHFPTIVAPNAIGSKRTKGSLSLDLCETNRLVGDNQIGEIVDERQMLTVPNVDRDLTVNALFLQIDPNPVDELLISR
jgi:hypothetical protein